jgi:hypothetical protein
MASVTCLCNDSFSTVYVNGAGLQDNRELWIEQIVDESGRDQF